jgi:hypothetical protein
MNNGARLFQRWIGFIIAAVPVWVCPNQFEHLSQRLDAAITATSSDKQRPALIAKIRIKDLPTIARDAPGLHDDLRRKAIVRIDSRLTPPLFM